MKENPNQTPLFGMDINLLDSVHRQELFRQDLLTRLQEMDHLDYERLTVELLKTSGFSNVQLADRIDRRGRTLQGGLDLKAYPENDIATSLTIAMVKQYDYPVPRRFVDELCNTMGRVGAQHGLLITTSTFGAIACRVAAADPHRPITLIDGNELVDLLISHQIGVKYELVTRLALDEPFLTDRH